MGWLPIAFGFPAILVGLLALPLIWWLLRFTPPKPQTEVFPPLRILARVLRKEETPQQSPWWLTLLRLLMAALVIMALAEPVWNPRERIQTSSAGLALVIDNSWAAAPDWNSRVATAERLINDAAASGSPVVLAFTAELPNAEIGPFDAQAARDHLRAATPRPVPADRMAVYARAAQAISEMPGATVALLVDGVATPSDEVAFRALLAAQAGNYVWAAPARVAAIGLVAADNEVDGFGVTAIRAPGNPAPEQVVASASDDRGRRIAETTLGFGPGDTTASSTMTVPFELRNDFALISLDGQPQAGAVRVLDDSAKRRRVGLISQAEADQAQPLLSPLYYIRNALEPFADLVQPSSSDLAISIPEILEQKPAMIVLADVGTIPPAARDALVQWVHNGGTLVRFAGQRLAAAENDEELLPVRLRLGERALGGTLSWTQPQQVSDFPPNGPFAGLSPPTDVTVTRQVLAEPTPDLAENTWANLGDGTPLVTGARRQKGTVVLFHVTPASTWSNLPISGTFVDMLRRIVQLSRNQGSVTANPDQTGAALPPFRMIAADGQLIPPTPEARPLPIGDASRPMTLEHPPGLYGDETGLVAHNLLSPEARLDPVVRPDFPVAATDMQYALDESHDMRGSLLIAALLLLALDTLAVLWMGGRLSRRPRRAITAATALAATAIMMALPVVDARAQAEPRAETQASDMAAIDAISATRIAYVVTGDSSVDAISRAGLTGLSAFLIAKTALEPAAPAGVDIASDELSFYPLIYWPIDAAAPMPSPEAVARVDAYMKQGGTVLFDTRDQYTTSLDAGSSPANARLRDILDDLNIPALEPVPEDHVLTKTFFIMQEFPGRFSGSPLWVEASTDAVNDGSRPVRTGDGVTPIMITGNDLAGAWAVDQNGEPMLPTVPADPMQRVYALRAGVNIVMYMLTGNYKSDQVHVPALLERLGQ